MHRLNFKLDEFVRVSWVSDQARYVWEQKFTDLSRVFTRVERASVDEHFCRLRGAALLNCSPSELINLAKDASDMGLVAVPLQQMGSVGHYQSAGVGFNPDKPWEYKVAYGHSDHVRDLVHAYEFNDWSRVGYILGYPSCCRKFFQKYWVEEKWFDTTWPMVGQDDFSLLNFNPANNILLRWLGLRLVSHLPCSFTCESTQVNAGFYSAVADKLGLSREWEQLIEILSWPVEWNSLHGVAQIITPVCKITTASDALATPCRVRLHSNKLPSETGRGNSFPFILDTWTANGFATKEAMDVAHRLIINKLADISLSFDSVLDLGCGNSVLLNEIKLRFMSKITEGVDFNPMHKPTYAANIFDFTPNRHYDLILVAEQRTLENPEWFQTMIATWDYDNILVYEHNSGRTKVYAFQSNYQS